MFDDLLENAAAARAESGNLRAVERVCAMPERFLEDDTSLVPKWSARFRRHAKAPPLLPKQAETLEECELNAALPGVGVFGALGVGAGKTLTFLLMSRVFGAKRPLYLTFASLVEKTQRDIFEWSQHYDFDVPEIVSYERLSQEDSSDFLTRMAPDLIMADEAHALANPTAARTKRFTRYIKTNPETRFACMSGSFGGGEIARIHHLSMFALRDFSPLPHEKTEADRWGAVLDADAEPGARELNNLWPLVEWAGTQGIGDHADAGRLAFQKRFRTAPGVVSTSDMSCDVPIVLTPWRPRTSELVKDALRMVAQYKRPDGEPMVFAAEKSACAKQASLGFYLVWDWPDGAVDTDWLDARRAWAGGVRRYLTRYAREKCDSPALVEKMVRAGGGPSELRHMLECWDAQAEKRFYDPDSQKYLPHPPQRAVWFDLTMMANVVRWGLSQQQAIVWYYNPSVGEMLSDLGMYCPRGEEPDFKASPVVALSMNIYGTGFNLQSWNNQLVLQPPSGAVMWEQMLGRTHRTNQLAPRVDAAVYMGTFPYINAVQKALHRSAFAEDALAQKQRLLQAVWAQ